MWIRFRSLLISCCRSQRLRTEPSHKLCSLYGRRHYSEVAYERSYSPHISRLRLLQDALTSSYHDTVLKKDERFIDEITEELTNIVSQRSLDTATLQATGKIIRLLGTFHKFYYNQRFFDSLSEAIMKSDDEGVMIYVLPSFLWSCTRLRYYPQSLLTHAGQYIPDMLRHFSIKSLTMIVNAYATLNHPIPNLIPKAEELVLGDPNLLQEGMLVWSLAWAGMVLQDYPLKLLQLILNDENVEDNERDFILFQLKISLNIERPELQLGLGWESREELRKWCFCKSGIRGISDKTMRLSLSKKLDMQTSLRRSVFGSNLQRAIRTALGGSKCFQSDPISLSGYNFDFEVLLDENGAPIHIPMQWRYRSSRLLRYSIGYANERMKREKIKLSTDFMKSIKEAEMNQSDDSKMHMDSIESADESSPRYKYEPSINVASDWGAKFGGLTRMVARKLIIEGDGPHHYACNCDHVLGHTALKRRHTECLGWELINVDYKVWRDLETGADQTAYVRSMIYQQ